jgi:hypothetical protein
MLARQSALTLCSADGQFAERLTGDAGPRAATHQCCRTGWISDRNPAHCAERMMPNEKYNGQFFPEKFSTENLWGGPFPKMWSVRLRLAALSTGRTVEI